MASRFMLTWRNKRQGLLKSACNLVKYLDSILFYYTDINYRLKIKWKKVSRGDDFFTSIDDLKSHLDRLV